MVSINPKLKYLQGQLDALEKNQQELENQIGTLLPSQILERNALENQLYIIFDNIEKEKQEIQKEQKKCRDKLVQKKFDELIEILQPAESLRAQIQQIYQNTLLHWPVKVKQNVDDVQSIVNELNKIAQGSLTYSALDEFIANLFHEISDDNVVNDLTQWGQEYCQSRDWLSLYKQIQESQNKRLENAQPAIFITITRSDEASTQSQDGETYYQLESWLIEDIDTYQTKKTGFYSLLAAGCQDNIPCLLENLLQNITRLLNGFITEQLKHCQGCENYPQIHVFLPIELMHLGVDAWSLDPTSKPPEYLGHDYLVFIHCGNRYDGTYRKEPSWRKIWKRQQALLQDFVLNVFIAVHDSDINNLRDILDDYVKPESADSKVVGLYVTDVPIDVKRLLEDVLDVGLPISIWCRKDLPDKSHKTQIEDLLKASYLGDLPTKVKEKRHETRKTKNTEVNHIGHHLSLLWDDPHFYPPKSA